ncbi:AAA family ATPase [Helicobacter cetorum]|uniref:AAA family ATPase n=1 Tax=Helicobacter cetorum TaxID=138563 RepID=UPI001F243FE0|nr:AAA family ATPase [Helicobacter cetorum]
MKLHKRILRLHHFRNLGKDLPTELLLNADFANTDFDGIKHGGLVILVGENNVGKSNVLEGLKYFNNDNNFLCPIEDYEKQAKERAALSLIKEVYNNDNNQQQIEKLSWVELKENKSNKQAFEMSSYPFENHMKMLTAQCTRSDDNASYSRISWFDNHFIQSIREALETLLPCADDSLSHKKYCQELKNSWHNFFNQHEKTLRLNEIRLGKYITPIQHKNKRKANKAYKNLKKALLLHICLTFKEYSLSKIKPGVIEFKKQKSKELEQAEEIFKSEKQKLLSNVENEIRNQSDLCEKIVKGHVEEQLKKFCNETCKTCDKDMANLIWYDSKEKELYKHNSIINEFLKKICNLKDLFCKNALKAKQEKYPTILNVINEKYRFFKDNIDKAKSIIEVIKYCEDFDRFDGLMFERMHSELFKPLSSNLDLKYTVTDKAILHNHLPQIINCENPFEIKDEDLYADILEKIHHGRVWQTMCFEWYGIKSGFVFDILHETTDSNETHFLFDGEKHTLNILGNQWLEISLAQEIFENKVKIPQNTSWHNILYMGNSFKVNNDEQTMKKAKAVGCIFQMSSKIDEKYNATFTFYDLEDNFLFDKKTNLLDELEKELKRMGEKISKEFNESYCINPNNEHRYIFEFHLEEHCFLHIKIKRDNEYLELAKQSTGFQWFFNFFFNFLYPYRYHKKGINRELGKNSSYRNYNSIVVMDEPATHLSVPARQEFIERLRRYSKKWGITFVLATHDPFLVDTDHLDEIRIVERQANGPVIYNEFNYSLNNASNDSDALDKIKRSLGVEQHIFHNPRKHRIIFVEGITDYCYLSAFKLYFNERYPQYKDNPIPFTFLPISGLKNNAKNMETTIDKLCELDNNPIVLIDDDRKDEEDDKPSEQFKKTNEKMGSPIKILQLSQCDENFKQIEDLFSDEDQQKYSLKDKDMALAIAFKNELYIVSHKLNNKHYQYPLNNQDVVSKQAEINFLYLFEWIACNLSSVKN